MRGPLVSGQTRISSSLGSTATASDIVWLLMPRGSVEGPLVVVAPANRELEESKQHLTQLRQIAAFQQRLLLVRRERAEHGERDHELPVLHRVDRVPIDR